MWKPKGATLLEEEWKPPGATPVKKTTPIMEAIGSVEENKERKFIYDNIDTFTLKELEETGLSVGELEEIAQKRADAMPAMPAARRRVLPAPEIPRRPEFRRTPADIRATTRPLPELNKYERIIQAITEEPALGIMEATRIPAIFGEKLPQPKTLAQKIGRTAGSITEGIAELLALSAPLTKLGVLSKAPKGAAFWQKMPQLGALFATTEATDQLRKGIAEQLHPEIDSGYQGAPAVLTAFVEGAVLSMAFSGVSGIWNKLKPSEQSRALKLLGLKKGATVDQIRRKAAQVAKKYHPDKVKGMRSQFEKVIRARETLTKTKQDIIKRGAGRVARRGLMLPGETAPTVPEKRPRLAPERLPAEKAAEIRRKGVKAPAVAPKAPRLAPEPSKPIKPPEVAPKAEKPTPIAEVSEELIPKVPLKAEEKPKYKSHPKNARTFNQQKRVKGRAENLGLRATYDGTKKQWEVWLPSEGKDAFLVDLSKAKKIYEGRQPEKFFIEYAKSEAPKAKGEVKKKISAKEEFKVGDVINTKGQSNMADPVTIREIKGNMLKFTDAKGVEYTGMARATVRRLIEGGSWERTAPPAPKAEEPWEMTVQEYLQPKVEWAKKVSRMPPHKTMGPQISIKWHRHYVQKALKEGKIVPEKVLQEYKAEKWAQEALAKPEALKEKPKGKPGIVDVTPLLKAHQTFMRVLEPAKAVERKLGKAPYAAVIKGIHQTDVGRLEFNQAELAGHDKNIQQLGEWFNKFPDKDLRNLMLSRGQPMTVGAQVVQENAINNLPKALRGPKVRNAIQQIADFNYAYLKKVAKGDINKVADYFYGIYKSPKKVDKFLDYWRTTKRFTKEKKLPTVADAVDYGLELKSNNPVENLKAEYVAIAHLEGMNWLKDELLRTGKGRFIEDVLIAPVEWEKVNDPVFRELRVDPDLAKLINSLIATNKLTKVPTLNTLRQANNVLRTTKFIGSAFHLISIGKQAIADSGYLGFLYKKTATRGLTTGFRKNDPIYRTPAYKDYIRHGGGHRYSVESEARRAFAQTVDELNKNMGLAVKAGALLLKIPTGFVNWMFNSYIPKVKYAKYLDYVIEREKKLGRKLKSSEKIDIIKEGQNFYGMMNERLFGRSGTVTTALRFYFLSPGYAEGDYRSILKAALQWGGKEGYRASRSRSNIINSWIITAMGATAATLAFTGKPPKKPEDLESIRDLFKIDTGKVDGKGHRIMIDLMTYDKDYWNVAFNILRLRPDIALGKSIRRIGGMKSPTADMILDLASMSMGRAIYDWKGDRVYHITDPILQKVMKLTVHEIKKLEPISVSVYKQSRKRDIDKTVAAVETLLGARPTTSEADKREKALLAKMYSLRGQREEMSWWIGKSTDPRGLIKRYNKTVNDILESPYIPESLKKEWSPKLLIDEKKAVLWKRFPVGKMTDSELRAAFENTKLKTRSSVTGREAGEPKKGYEQRHSQLKAEMTKRGLTTKRGTRLQREKRMLRK